MRERNGSNNRYIGGSRRGFNVALFHKKAELMKTRKALSETVCMVQEAQAIAETAQEIARTLIDDSYMDQNGTGLYNKKWFLEELSKRTQEPENPPLCLLFLDIDHFGLVNKQYHQGVGDQILNAVKLLVNEEEDMSRYGGEEFCMLGNWTDEEAIQLFERLQHGMSTISGDILQKNTPLAGCSSLGPNYFSMGLVRYIPGETAESFRARASQAANIAKHRGRRRMVIDNGPNEQDKKIVVYIPR